MPSAYPDSLSPLYKPRAATLCASLLSLGLIGRCSENISRRRSHPIPACFSRSGVLLAPAQSFDENAKWAFHIIVRIVAKRNFGLLAGRQARARKAPRGSPATGSTLHSSKPGSKGSIVKSHIRYRTCYSTQAKTLNELDVLELCGQRTPRSMSRSSASCRVARVRMLSFAAGCYYYKQMALKAPGMGHFVAIAKQQIRSCLVWTILQSFSP